MIFQRKGGTVRAFNIRIPNPSWSCEMKNERGVNPNLGGTADFIDDLLKSSP